MASLGILQLNTRGRLAHDPQIVTAAVATAAAGGPMPHILLLSETCTRPDSIPPTLQGYVLAHFTHSALAAGGQGRGGVAIYVTPSLVGLTSIWGDAHVGGGAVAWVRVQAVADRPVHIAACYMPPNLSVVGSEQFFGRLLRDVLRAREAGYVAVGGDFNGRTGVAADGDVGDGELAASILPHISERLSVDTTLNAQGRALLGFCREAGLWIANGRLPGDIPGQWTYHSIQNPGATSVVDYFLLDADLLGAAGAALTVHLPEQCLDHTAIVLTLGEGALPQANTHASGVGPSPAGTEFIVDPALLPAFAAAVEAVGDAWAGITARASQAGSGANLDALGSEFDGLLRECAVVAGFREAGSQRPGGDRPPRPPGGGRLRRQRRQALRRGDMAAAAALQRLACAVARRHRRQKHGARVRRLLEWRQSDPARFYRALRGQRSGPLSSIAVGDWVIHFVGLVGQRPTRCAAAPTQGVAALDRPVEESPAALEAKARMQAPFTSEELCTVVRCTGNNKAVLGALKPVMLKATLSHLAVPLVEIMNACVRIGALPQVWAVSALVPIRKPGAAHQTPEGYRGIAVGTLLAKLYAGMLNDRISAYTEAAGIRATGQAGFRRGFGCNDQTLALRVIIERQRARGQRLYACFVDFKQAFDRVPRDWLWLKLERAGIDGWALQAVQALYASVPFSVKTPAGFTPCFPSLMGVKQGCPLSPTLFGLYLDDFESGLLATVGAETASLPTWENGVAVPPLFYADDQALLAVTAAGLQRQLEYLAEYCDTWGLTVNTVKTKVVVYAAAAPRSVGDFRYQGTAIERNPCFKYLGVQLHSSHAFCSAGAARAVAGKQAVHILQRRMAQCGLQCHPTLAMSLFDVFVRPVMSYGVEVWGPQLIVSALSGKAPDACEKVHLGFLRQLLGVRDTCCALTVQAETGRLPLASGWAQQVARFVNRLTVLDDSRVAKQAMLDSVALAAAGGAAGHGRQCWAAEVGEMCRLLHQDTSFLRGELPERIDIGEVADASARRHYDHYDRYCGASTMVMRYQEEVTGEAVDQATYRPAAHLTAVPARKGRQTLARLRLGCSWVGDDVGRTQRRPRDQRPCQHCQAPLQSAAHVLLACPQYAPLRAHFPQLFPEGQTLKELYAHPDQAALARFAHQCYELDVGSQGGRAGV